MSPIRIRSLGGPAAALLLSLAVVGCSGNGEYASQDEDAKLPITTASEDARELFVKGRELLENLRPADARVLFEQAVEKDPQFAWGHLMLANSATTGSEFFDALGKAVELAVNASEGERHMILAANDGATSNPEGQLEHLQKLIELYPDDERAHQAMGTVRFGRQEFDEAARHSLRATEINPEYSPSYNMLGYSYRFAERYDDAEAAFKQYIERVPSEPNPYDSYAEFLMKRGRFDESIEQYQRALEVNPTFIASFVGIANNQMFLDRTSDARETMKELEAAARNDGERRQALFWTAVSYLHDKDSKQALAVLERRAAVAEETGDLTTLAGDYNLMGNVLVESGDAAGALASYELAVKTMDGADAPDAAKQATRRNFLFNSARAALAAGDVDTARSRHEEYSTQVAEHQVPFEMRQTHDLAGMIAMAEGNAQQAIEALEQGNQRNPRIIYLTAQAYERAGQAEPAHAYCDKVANFNELNLNLAFVRSSANEMLQARR